MKEKKINYIKGFTLLELLVAMGLFVVFMGIATGGFIKTLRTQQLITQLMSANDNASLAVEQMSREIRVGYDFCTFSQQIPEIPDCGNLSANELMFKNGAEKTVIYRLGNDDVISRGEGTDFFSARSNFSPITGNDVKVGSFNIYLFKNQKNDGYPTRVTIKLSVSPKNGPSYLNSIFTNIQTTISSRSSDDY